MNHTIKQIDWDSIINLSKQVLYSEASEAIRFIKGSRKLPTTFRELMNKVKMIYNG